MRVEQAFHVLYGIELDNENIDDQRYQLGLLDYAFPFTRLFINAFNKSATNKVTAAMLIIPTIALYIVKLAAAVSLTFIAAPLIAFVHLFTRPFFARLDKKAQEVSVRQPINAGHENWTGRDDLKFSKEMKLNELFHQFEMERLIIKPIYKFLKLHGVFYWKREGNLDTKLYLGVFNAHYSFTIWGSEQDGSPENDLLGIIELNKENADAIRAMLKINKFSATVGLQLESELEPRLESEFANIEGLLKVSKVDKDARQALIQGLLKVDRNVSPLKKLNTLAPADNKKVLSLFFCYSGHANEKHKNIVQNPLENTGTTTQVHGRVAP